VILNSSCCSINPIKLFILNLSREQEFDNAAWANVDLFDAGTDLSPGQLDVRFSTLWCQYSDEMTSRSWAGTAFDYILFCLLSFFPDFSISFQDNLKLALYAKFFVSIVVSGKYDKDTLKFSFATF
jgi:hypothetical protein